MFPSFPKYVLEDIMETGSLNICLILILEEYILNLEK